MTIEDLLAVARTYLVPQHVAKIVDAYELARRGAHGSATVQHALAIARLLAEMRIDVSGILAALLYPLTAGVALDVIRTQFGEAVGAIITGVINFDALLEQAIRDESPQEGVLPSLRPVLSFYKRYQNSDTANKLLLAMAEEPYIVILKIADSLHKMRSLEKLTLQQQRSTVSDAHHIYVPLARRLGMELVHAELEDLVFEYLAPEKYAQLKRELEQELNRRQVFIDQVCQSLRKQLGRTGMHTSVYFRPKHLASIQRKVENGARNGPSTVEKVRDLVLFRVIVDYDHDCYLALGHIQALWRPKEGRIKDFIATPRINGYQSLHTTVFVADQQSAEIQVRTHDMERTANYGIANSWYLKDHAGRDIPPSSAWRLFYREMRSWIELLREWQHEQPQEDETTGSDIFREQIFVFTPRGEVRYLPRGSTVLDMAYRIHTNLGDHCAGGRVIMNVDDSDRLVTRTVALDYQLKGGEIVDIATHPETHPSQEWLSFVRTDKARTFIKHYLKAHAQVIRTRNEHEVVDDPEQPGETLLQPSTDGMQVVKLASCCCPFPDEAIVGLPGTDGDLLVHCRDCRMLRPYYDKAQDVAGVLVPLDWQQIQPENYLVPITLVARDRGGLLRDVSAVIADANISVAEVRTSSTSSLQKTIITAILEIASTDEIAEQIEALFLRLREVMSVVSVERVREKNLPTTQDLDTYYWEMYRNTVHQTLIRQGVVDTSLFPGVPVMYVDQVLERYMQVHAEMNLEYQEQLHLLQLKCADSVQRLDSLLQRILQCMVDGTVEAHIVTLERYINRILQVFSSSVGFGEVSPLDLDDFVAYSIDTRAVFESLILPRQLPILVSFEVEMSDATIELLRHLLLMRKQATESHVLVLLMFCDNQKLDQARRRVVQMFSRTFAYDIAIINHEDILALVSAREPERALRRLILSQVSLSAVSPYKAQGPTPTHLFFGREHEMREIVENAKTTSYALIGGRRIGKTSILKRLELESLPVAGFRALYHDCSYTGTEGELIQAVVTGNRRWFPAGTSASAFPSFANVIQSLAGEQPLVILLDEADKLIATDRATGYPVFNSLRALSNTGLCTFILSGERALHTELTNPYSPLYNFAGEMLIGRLDFMAVQELVIRPMKRLEIILVDEVEIVRRIWKFTSGHPSVVQSLCQRLITRLNKRQIRPLTVDDVEVVVAHHDFARKDFLSVYWERATILERLCSLIMVEDAQIRTLAAVHAALQRLDLAVTLNQVDEALENLVDLRNILQRTADGYEFAVTALPLVITKTGRPHDLIALNCETYRQSGDAELHRKRGTV